MIPIKPGTAQRLGIRRPRWTLDRLGNRASDLRWDVLTKALRAGAWVSKESSR